MARQRSAIIRRGKIYYIKLPNARRHAEVGKRIPKSLSSAATTASVARRDLPRFLRRAEIHEIRKVRGGVGWKAGWTQRFWRKCREALQIGMSPKHLPQTNSSGATAAAFALLPDEVPLTVREAAVHLGVSIQKVYLWVERKQIPHLRVMGRNIRINEYR